MPQIRRADLTTRALLIALAAPVAVAVAVGLADPALAAPGTATPAPTIQPTATATATAELQRFGAGILGLQHRADAARHRLDLARARVRSARTSVSRAAAAATDLRQQASSAAERTSTSRRRAGLLAVTLARTDMNDVPTQLVVDSASATQMLQGLSAVAQLTVQTHAVLTAAEDDQRRIAGLRAAADATVLAADHRLAIAITGFHSARSASMTALTAVHDQEHRVEQLVSRLVDLRRAELSPTELTAAGHRLGARAVAFARAQIGEPYRLGAAGPDAWDCSGLTLGAYASLGIDIGPHLVSAQYAVARRDDELVPFSEVQPGDLLFYTDGGGGMTHEALYSGDGMMIEAPHAGASVREVPLRFDGLVAEIAHIAR